MKLSAADLAIIASTLYRSLLIVGDSVWTHTEEARQETLEKVHDLMKSIDIGLTEVQQPIKRIDTEAENQHEDVDLRQLCSDS